MSSSNTIFTSTYLVVNLISRDNKGAFYLVEDQTTHLQHTLRLYPEPTHDEIINGSVVRDSTLFHLANAKHNHPTNLLIPHTYYQNDNVSFSLSDPIAGTVQDLYQAVLDHYHNQNNVSKDIDTDDDEEDEDEEDEEEEMVFKEPFAYPISLPLYSTIKVKWTDMNSTHHIRHIERIKIKPMRQENMAQLKGKTAQDQECKRQDAFVAQHVCVDAQHMIHFLQHELFQQVLIGMKDLMVNFHHIHNGIDKNTIGYRWLPSGQIQFCLMNFSFIQRSDLPYNIYQNMTIHANLCGPEFTEYFYTPEKNHTICVENKDVYSLGLILGDFMLAPSFMTMLIQDEDDDNDEVDEAPKGRRRHHEHEEEGGNTSEESEYEIDDEEEDDDDEYANSESDVDIESEVDEPDLLEDDKYIGEKELDSDIEIVNSEDEENDIDEDEDEDSDPGFVDKTMVEDEDEKLEELTIGFKKLLANKSPWRFINITIEQGNVLRESFEALGITYDSSKPDTYLSPVTLVSTAKHMLTMDMWKWLANNNNKTNELFFQQWLHLMIPDPTLRPTISRLSNSPQEQQTTVLLPDLHPYSPEWLHIIKNCYKDNDLHPILAYPFLLTTCRTYDRLIAKTGATSQESQLEQWLLSSILVEAYFLDAFHLPVSSESVFTRFRPLLSITKIAGRRLQLSARQLYWTLLDGYLEPFVPLEFDKAFQATVKNEKKSWLVRVDKGMYGEPIQKKENLQIQYMWNMFRTRVLCSNDDHEQEHAWMFHGVMN